MAQNYEALKSSLLSNLQSLRIYCYANWIPWTVLYLIQWQKFKRTFKFQKKHWKYINLIICVDQSLEKEPPTNTTMDATFLNWTSNMGKPNSTTNSAKLYDVEMVFIVKFTHVRVSGYYDWILWICSLLNPMVKL